MKLKKKYVECILFLFGKNDSQWKQETISMNRFCSLKKKVMKPLRCDFYFQNVTDALGENILGMLRKNCQAPFKNVSTSNLPFFHEKMKFLVLESELSG